MSGKQGVESLGRGVFDCTGSSLRAMTRERAILARVRGRGAVHTGYSARQQDDWS